MHLNRFYCKGLKGPDVELVGSEAHHLHNVCRLKTGSEVELFDGSGILAKAIIKKITGRSVLLKVVDLKKTKKSNKPKVVIAVSCPKGERFDWLIGKCTELGVDHITAVIFERTIKQPKNPKVVERWRNIAIAAAKQCRRIFLPQIDTPVTLSKALPALKKQYNKAEILVGGLEPKLPALITQRFDEKNVIAVIGPEGGITENEKFFLDSYRAKFVRLTSTVLRIETAALAFAAILTVRRDNIVKEKQ